VCVAVCVAVCVVVCVAVRVAVRVAVWYSPLWSCVFSGCWGLLHGKHCRLQCIAVCCSVLQCVAVCCSVLHSSITGSTTGYRVLQCVLQCVTVRCRAASSVAVGCSIMGNAAGRNSQKSARDCTFTVYIYAMYNRELTFENVSSPIHLLYRAEILIS